MNKKQAAKRQQTQEQAAKQESATRRNVFIAIVVIAALITAWCLLYGNTLNQTTAAEPTEATEIPATTDETADETAGETPAIEGTPVIAIEVEGYGTITAELYPDVAPITVANFLKLVDEGFYDGLTFHRIISGFMIQGGDPLGNGTGGSDQTIKGEFSANGVENNLKHTRGVLSMARSSDPNSASSQFFIMHQDTASLDGNYAAFGKVIEGIEIVDAICENTPAGNNGAVDKANQPVITSIRRVDAE